MSYEAFENKSEKLNETLYQYVSHGNELIDDYWFDYWDGLDHEEIDEEFLQHYISFRDYGYYMGTMTDSVAKKGFCLSLAENYEIRIMAEYANPQMVMSEILQNRRLNKYEQANFDNVYSEGYIRGQAKISKQLYELAQMGEYKAIDKFLEVRGAFKETQKETGPAIQITLDSELPSIDVEYSEDNIVKFPSQKQ